MVSTGSIRILMNRELNLKKKNTLGCLISENCSLVSAVINDIGKLTLDIYV